ncbi:TPA: Gfo/Idh/MocA family protein [Streptococcus agalactiae]
MKLAVLGTGMIVKEVLPVLQKIEGIDLVAILSTVRSLETAKDLAKEYNMSLATSEYKAVLDNEEIDTVYIGLPNHLHFDYAKEALLAGKHVICEKPFTLEASQLEELVSIANTRQLILLEAITNQYLPNFDLVKEHLSNLGDIKIVECNYSQYSSRYDAFKRGEIAPAFNPEMGGGALRDLNIYNLHLVIGLFGEPITAQYLPNIERGIDTSGVLVLDYGHFKTVCIGAKDWSAEVKSTIQGDKGSIAILGPTNTMPKISLTMNGQESHVYQLNGDRHRMHDEFVIFEGIISNLDFKRAAQALEHSRTVMKVLDMVTK